MKIINIFQIGRNNNLDLKLKNQNFAFNIEVVTGQRMKKLNSIFKIFQLL